MLRLLFGIANVPRAIWEPFLAGRVRREFDNVLLWLCTCESLFLSSDVRKKECLHLIGLAPGMLAGLHHLH
jgi:hypothetical protein